MKRTLFTFALPLLLLLGGCAHVLSQEALLTVDPLLDYAQVKADPEAYKGKALLLGGLIVETRVGREGTTLEVLRYTLDRWGRPDEVDEAGGRFLVRTDRFLDPELYRPGQMITLTGRVEGREVRSLQDYDYPYPVFRIGEAYVWSRPVPYYSYPSAGYYDPYYPWGPYRSLPHRGPFWGYDPYGRYPYWYWPPGRRLK